MNPRSSQTSDSEARVRRLEASFAEFKASEDRKFELLREEVAQLRGLAESHRTKTQASAEQKLSELSELEKLLEQKMASQSNVV